MGTLRVDPEPGSASLVRRTLGQSLSRRGLSGPVIDDVVLVASELFGNSVRYAAALPAGDLRVSWEVDGRGVMVRVTDGGSPHEPHLATAAPGALGGRGLRIVEALATSWGVVTEPGGITTVWALLALR